MDDRFLHEHRREPRAAFTRALREKLRDAEVGRAARRPWRLAPAVGAFAAVAAIVSLFAFPAVRAVAQNALDVFRVRSFAPVEFDPSHMERLKAIQSGQGTDPAALLFSRQEVLRKAAPPEVVASLEEAAVRSGLTKVLEPSSLPYGLERDEIRVTHESVVRLVMEGRHLREALDVLDLGDVTVPQGLDGQPVTVRMPATVTQQFRNERGTVHLIQAPSPEVTLPPGVRFAELAELGLRVLGLDRDEARRVAGQVDWRTTLLVPVPSGAASFQSVTVRGHQGLLIRKVARRDDGRSRPDGGVVMWTEGQRVLALSGGLGPEDLVQVAESLR